MDKLAIAEKLNRRVENVRMLMASASAQPVSGMFHRHLKELHLELASLAIEFERAARSEGPIPTAGPVPAARLGGVVAAEPPRGTNVEHLATMVGMDEYGPMLEWRRPWTDFRAGLKLYIIDGGRNA